MLNVSTYVLLIRQLILWLVSTDRASSFCYLSLWFLSQRSLTPILSQYRYRYRWKYRYHRSLVSPVGSQFIAGQANGPFFSFFLELLYCLLARPTKKSVFQNWPNVNVNSLFFLSPFSLSPSLPLSFLSPPLFFPLSFLSSLPLFLSLSLFLSISISHYVSNADRRWTF